jgi:hypothetical protein
MRRKISFLIFYLLLAVTKISAQDIRFTGFEAQQGYLIGVNYAVCQPLGDLNDRFGAFTALAIHTQYKTKQNWQLGLDYQWQFGDNVKENNILDGLRNSEGQIIDANGQYSVVRIHQRGQLLSANVAKIFPLKENNANSGIFIEAGLGVYWHKIFVLSSRTTIPQLQDDYLKGYDRLTGGLALRQWAGYQYLDPRKRINFRVGMELAEAFTQSWRSWDTDLMQADDTKRRDMFSGLRVSLLLPVYTKAAEDEIFFDD